MSESLPMSEPCIVKQCASIARGQIQYRACTLDGCAGDFPNVPKTESCFDFYRAFASQIDDVWREDSVCEDPTGTYSPPKKADSTPIMKRKLAPTGAASSDGSAPSQAVATAALLADLAPSVLAAVTEQPLPTGQLDAVTVGIQGDIFPTESANPTVLVSLSPTSTATGGAPSPTVDSSAIEPPVMPTPDPVVVPSSPPLAYSPTRLPTAIPRRKSGAVSSTGKASLGMVFFLLGLPMILQAL